MPHPSDSLRCTASLGVIARMGAAGRYLHTRHAVLPDSVNATIAAAASWCAVLQAS